LPFITNFVNGTRNERDDGEYCTFLGARLPTSGTMFLLTLAFAKNYDAQFNAHGMGKLRSNLSSP